MNIARTSIAVAISALISSVALAQSTSNDVQRDVNQQQRIEQGLQSGSLNMREAAKLEKQETRVEITQKNALKDGTITPGEQTRIQNQQNAVSRDIARQKHDAQTGNPNSASSQRMQADVQRNVNQQARIEQGVDSGQLTNRETGKLERGQAHVTAKEARAGSNGHVGAGEQQRIQAAENHQSARVYNKKHNVAAKLKAAS